MASECVALLSPASAVAPYDDAGLAVCLLATSASQPTFHHHAAIGEKPTRPLRRNQGEMFRAEVPYIDGREAAPFVERPVPRDIAERRKRDLGESGPSGPRADCVQKPGPDAHSAMLRNYIQFVEVCHVIQHNDLRKPDQLGIRLACDPQLPALPRILELLQRADILEDRWCQAGFGEPVIELERRAPFDQRQN